MNQVTVRVHNISIEAGQRDVGNFIAATAKPFTGDGDFSVFLSRVWVNKLDHTWNQVLEATRSSDNSTRGRNQNDINSGRLIWTLRCNDSHFVVTLGHNLSFSITKEHLRHVAAGTTKGRPGDHNDGAELTGGWRHIRYLTFSSIGKRISQGGDSTRVCGHDDISSFIRGISLNSHNLHNSVAFRRDRGFGTAKCDRVDTVTASTECATLDGNNGTDLTFCWLNGVNHAGSLVSEAASQCNLSTTLGSNHHIALRDR